MRTTRLRYIMGVATAGLLLLGLVGCGDLAGLWAAQRPGDQNPTIRWVSESTEILDLRGPATGKVGEPITLTVQAVIGSSSCNRAGEVEVTVDDAARRVQVRATRLTAQSDGELPCTDDYGWKGHEVSFTPRAAGPYEVTAERFKPGFLAPGEPVPQGSLSIDVRE